MKTWIYFNPNPAGRRVGDCAVRAVAKALGITWEESYALIAAGMTQQQLAEAVGVQKQAVSMWETGKSTPRADVLKRVAQVLDCTMDDLLP